MSDFYGLVESEYRIVGSESFHPRIADSIRWKYRIMEYHKEYLLNDFPIILVYGGNTPEIPR